MKDRAAWAGQALVVRLNALSPAAAIAQPVNVGASLLAGISRFTTIEIDPSAFASELTGGGETLGFSLVVGTALGDRWGVELEFGRPAVLEHSVERQVELLPPGLPVPPRPIPIFDSRFAARSATPR